MGRPRLAPDQRPVTQSVRLSAETADIVCRLALRRRTSVCALLGGIIERSMAQQKIRHPDLVCYDGPVVTQSSTLTTVVSAAPLVGASRIAEPLLPR
jgi:hypothetical protein